MCVCVRSKTKCRSSRGSAAAVSWCGQAAPCLAGKAPLLSLPSVYSSNSIAVECGIHPLASSVRVPPSSLFSSPSSHHITSVGLEKQVDFVGRIALSSKYLALVEAFVATLPSHLFLHIFIISLGVVFGQRRCSILGTATSAHCCTLAVY